MSTLPDLRENEAQLTDKVQAILAEAARQGAGAAEVSVSEDVGLGVTVRMRELESVEFNHDRGFGITVYLGGRRGSASTSDSSADAIRETVGAALNIARNTEEDPCAGLADPDRLATEMPDLDLYHPWDLEADAAERLARECEAAGLANDERIFNSDGASVSTQRSLKVYGNSHGFIGRYLASRHSISCMLIGRDAAGMQRDYWYTTARAADDLEAAEAVGEEAGRRTAARLSPRRVATGSFPVAFAPQAAAGLAGHLLSAISGGAQYRRASFLLDSLGETVAAEHLTLAEDPMLRRGMGSASFDGEGVATTAKAFIDRGVVVSYILSSYSGRKLKLPTSGNAGGVHNLTVSGTTLPLAELYAKLGTGVLVTDLMGQGVNPVTGDYSRGASGFWIESGEIAYPVDEITVASNLKDMLAGVVCLGDDLDTRGNLRAPTLLIERMTLAGG
jgi:PmbA protein